MASASYQWRSGDVHDPVMIWTVEAVRAQVVQPLFMMASRPLLSSVASAGIAGAVRGTPKAARTNIAATRLQKLPFRAKCNFVLNASLLLLGEPAGIEAAGK